MPRKSLPRAVARYRKPHPDVAMKTRLPDGHPLRTGAYAKPSPGELADTRTDRRLDSFIAEMRACVADFGTRIETTMKRVESAMGDLSVRVERVERYQMAMDRRMDDLERRLPRKRKALK